MFGLQSYVRCYKPKLLPSGKTGIYLGLGAFLVERSFFPENERNNQERSHRSEKKEHSERSFLQILERLVKERNGNCLKRTVKIVNMF